MNFTEAQLQDSSQAECSSQSHAAGQATLNNARRTLFAACLATACIIALKYITPICAAYLKDSRAAKEAKERVESRIPEDEPISDITTSGLSPYISPGGLLLILAICFKPEHTFDGKGSCIHYAFVAGKVVV